MHEVEQAVGPQMYGEQACGAGVTHEPLPLQVVAGCTTPLEQDDPAPQLVPEAVCLHWPAPLQVPSFPQGGAATHRASLPLVVMGAQVPDA
jgi:hypothetical protein